MMQGYSADHADIDLLRLRNYTVGRTIQDDELLDRGLDRIAELLTCMKPFVSSLHLFFLVLVRAARFLSLIHI